MVGAGCCGGFSKSAVFGVKVASGKVQYLGKDPKQQDVVVAKFTRDEVEWHGYPFQHTSPKRDVPRTVLDRLKADQLIGKVEYSRILRKQPC
jgi:hypothetical protein